MPELPEAEVVTRQLRNYIVGATLKSWWIGRPDIVREGLDSFEWYKDARIAGVERRGKSVVLEFRRDGTPRFMVVELGMTGVIFFHAPAERYQKHTHVVLWLEGGRKPELRYWNPRRFGRMHLLDPQGLAQYVARRFGCDPLSVPWPDFRRLVGSRRGRLKALLMDQRAIAGIGNIYANEILYRARLHPYRVAGRMRSRTIRRLYETMRDVLSEAVRDGGSSVRDFLAPDGTKGGYHHRHLVYNKAGQPCPARCGRAIRRLRGERSSFYCPACQRA